MSSKSYRFVHRKDCKWKKIRILQSFLGDLGEDIGEMLEWLKRHAWKACKLLKGFAGSNPALSA